MKHYFNVGLFLLTISIILSDTSYAQEAIQEFLPRKFTLGIKFGVNFSQLNGTATYRFFSNGVPKNYNLNQKLTTSFNIGGTMEYRLTSRTSLLGELLLSFEGGESESEKGYYSSGGYEFTTYFFQFTKLNIPFVLKYKFSKKLGFEIGPN
jgi:hypothetical protein